MEGVGREMAIYVWPELGMRNFEQAHVLERTKLPESLADQNQLATYEVCLRHRIALSVGTTSFCFCGNHVGKKNVTSGECHASRNNLI